MLFVDVVVVVVVVVCVVVVASVVAAAAVVVFTYNYLSCVIAVAIADFLIFLSSRATLVHCGRERGIPLFAQKQPTKYFHRYFSSKSTGKKQ